METKFYEGAKAISCTLGENVILGQDTFVTDSTLGNGVQVNRRNIIEDARIGSHSYTGANTVIKVADIGKFCSISWNVSMTGNIHNYRRASAHPFTRLSSFGFVDKSEPLEKKRIHVGNDVWIGSNACILPGVEIGDGAVIGAGGGGDQVHSALCDSGRKPGKGDQISIF